MINKFYSPSFLLLCDFLKSTKILYMLEYLLLIYVNIGIVCS